MTLKELQSEYPDAAIEAGIGGVHYQEGNDVLTVKYDFAADGENARQAAIDGIAWKIALLKS